MASDVIDVSGDGLGYVHMRHSSYAAAEQGRATFTMTEEEWEDLLFRAACYELERWKLPRTLPLERVLPDRLVLRAVCLNGPRWSRVRLVMPAAQADG